MILLGRQFVLTLDQCSETFINDPEQIIQSITAVTIGSKLTILKTAEHRFEPQGLTYILVLSQSHMIVHTWPEYRIMVVDLFVCTPDFDVDLLAQGLLSVSGAARAEKACVFER
jgi:S-adenosylmethionine decarboxylase